MAVRRILPAPPDPIRPDIPLFIVNIVLLLILFFLATGQITNGTPVEVRLAETTELPREHLPKPLLEIGPTGTLTRDGAPVAETALAEALAGADTLYILIARTAEASRLVEVLARPDLASVNLELVTLAGRGAGGGT